MVTHYATQVNHLVSRWLSLRHQSAQWLTVFAGKSYAQARQSYASDATLMTHGRCNKIYIMHSLDTRGVYHYLRHSPEEMRSMDDFKMGRAGDRRDRRWEVRAAVR